MMMVAVFWAGIKFLSKSTITRNGPVVSQKQRLPQNGETVDVDAIALLWVQLSRKKPDK
jgi:hypothetical protein